MARRTLMSSALLLAPGALGAQSVRVTSSVPVVLDPPGRPLG